jgi:hypothetical protein
MKNKKKIKHQVLVKLKEYSTLMISDNTALNFAQIKSS